MSNKYTVTNDNQTVDFLSEVDAQEYCASNSLDYAAISVSEFVVMALTTRDLDLIRYTKRAHAKTAILAELAANNMGRVRAGTWSVPQLISLTQDAELMTALADVNALSFELAMAKIQASTNELLTADIKVEWLGLLASNLFNG